MKLTSWVDQLADELASRGWTLRLDRASPAGALEVHRLGRVGMDAHQAADSLLRRRQDLLAMLLEPSRPPRRRPAPEDLAS